MKRILSALLVLAMVLALCGCSGGKSPAGTVTPAPQTQPEETPAPQTQPEETLPPETEAAEAESEFSLGTMTGGVYENAYAGFGCVLDDKWAYRTAEEMQDISAETMEMLKGSEFSEENDLYSTIMDMMAENEEDLVGMNVNYTRISASERVQFSLASEEQMIDATLEQKDSLIDAYAQAGIEVDTMEKVSVDFLGEERFAIHTTASYSGVPYYALQIATYNLGGQYYVTLTMQSFLEDNTTALLDLFYPV